MKRLLLTLIFTTFFASVAFAQESRGIVVEGVGAKYAVLIGVDDYEKIRKLRYAKNDMLVLRDQLYKIGFKKEDVFCLTTGGTSNERPTKSRIEMTLKLVLEEAKEGDFILIAMAGHGIELNENQARFWPVDADTQDMPGTTIPISEIFDAISRSKATYKLMLVDACRNDPLMGRNVLNARSLQTLDAPPKGFMLLQSCAKGEESFEDDDLKHGVFTYSFIEGLRGEAADKEGDITLFGLATHTIRKTTRRAHALNSSQRPYMLGETTDFVLAKVAKQQQAPSEARREQQRERELRAKREAEARDAKRREIVGTWRQIIEGIPYAEYIVTLDNSGRYAMKLVDHNNRGIQTQGIRNINYDGETWYYESYWGEIGRWIPFGWTKIDDDTFGGVLENPISRRNENHRMIRVGLAR